MDQRQKSTAHQKRAHHTRSTVRTRTASRCRRGELRMFEVYVDKPLPSSETAPRPRQQHEPRLTNLVISCGGKEATLSPSLNFESFADLKAQVEALVPSLPEFGEGTGWLVFSLQYCDERGNLVTLLHSTFDPAEFCEPRLPSGQKAYLRATVAPNPVVHGKGRASAPSGAPPRRALGHRDENTLPAAATRGERAPGGAAGKATPAARKATTAKATPARKATATAVAPAATLAATPTAATTARPPVTLQRSKTAATAIASTPRQQQDYFHVHTSNSIGSSSRSSSRGRAPAYVFKAGGAGSSGNGSDPSCSFTREANSRPPLPSRKQREKPGWNSGNEPAWEEVSGSYVDYSSRCFGSPCFRPAGVYVVR